MMSAIQCIHCTTNLKSKGAIKPGAKITCPKCTKRFIFAGHPAPILGKLLGGGGEGEVYQVTNRKGLVAKIYKQELRTPEKEAKVEEMIRNPPQDDCRKLSPPHISIAWPEEIYRENGKFAGYLMPGIDLKVCPEIFAIYSPQLRDKGVAGNFNWQHLHRVAQNLAIAIHAIHSRGYVVGDVNQRNVLVSMNTMVTIIDTDSFQVRDLKRGKMYRCVVGVEEFQPRELQGVDFKTVDREPFHDCFGLAILVFQLLMDGVHPFTGTHQNPGFSAPGGRMDLHCIKQGIFPHQSNGPIAPPPSSPDFTALHPELQQLFVRCFVNGHKMPSKRPTALEWVHALIAAEKGLVQCRKNSSHMYSGHQSSCHHCEREKKFPAAVSAAPVVPGILVQSGLIASPKARPRTPNKVGIWSFKLGLWALAGSWIPCLGFLTLPLSAGAFVTAGIGGGIALMGGKQEYRSSIFGACTSGVAFLLPFIFWALISYGIQKITTPNEPKKPAQRSFEERILGNKAANGKLLEAADKDNKKNTNVQLGSLAKDNQNQRWQMIPVATEHFLIVCKANGLALEANSDKDLKANGCPVRLGTLTKTPIQQWRLEKAGEYVKIVNRENGKVLEANPNVLLKEGGGVQLWEANKDDRCLWKIQGQ